MSERQKPGPKPKQNPEIEKLEQTIVVLIERLDSLERQVKSIQSGIEAARATIEGAKVTPYNRHM